MCIRLDWIQDFSLCHTLTFRQTWFLYTILSKKILKSKHRNLDWIRTNITQDKSYVSYLLEDQILFPDFIPDFI